MASSNLNDYVNEVCKALDYREGIKVSFDALNFPYDFFLFVYFEELSLTLNLISEKQVLKRKISCYIF